MIAFFLVGFRQRHFSFPLLESVGQSSFHNMPIRLHICHGVLWQKSLDQIEHSSQICRFFDTCNRKRDQSEKQLRLYQTKQQSLTKRTVFCLFAMMLCCKNCSTSSLIASICDKLPSHYDAKFSCAARGA